MIEVYVIFIVVFGYVVFLGIVFATTLLVLLMIDVRRLIRKDKPDE